MGIRQILDKINFEGIDPREKNELLAFMDSTEHANGLINSWVRPGEHRIGAHGLSGNPFMGATNMATSSAQTIANVTETPIAWGRVLKQGEIKINTARILLPTQNTLYGIMGRVSFRANSTGYRSVTLQFYDESDVNLWGETLAGLPAMTESLTVPFATGVWAPAASYFKVNVIQNSGGDLIVDYADCTVFTVNTERK